MKEKKRNITLIAGPTASGKSRLAARLGKATNSVIVNADSMQVYDVLHLLTARPQHREMQKLPHYLYGFVHPSQNFSTGLWQAHVRDLVQQPDLQHKNLIFVGGTGLYFRALCGGLAEIPPIPPIIRDALRQRLQDEGAQKLHAELHRKDKTAAARIKPQDGQRVIRALEVLAATGHPLHYWQQQKTASLVDGKRAQKILILPERATLYQRIESRFDEMLAQGALDEVRALMALGIDATMPTMKAIGVRELAQVLEGNWSIERAKERAKIATRQYAKRQMTWFSTQFAADWQIFSNLDNFSIDL